MTDDDEMHSEAVAPPVVKNKKPYCTPTVVDYGPIGQIAQSGASGGSMDGIRMASSCSGNCM